MSADRGSIARLVADLIAAGATPEAIGIAVEAMVTRPSTGAERTRRYRERRHTASQASQNVTSDALPPDGPPSPRSPLPPLNPPTPSAPPSGEAVPTAKRGQRIPAAFPDDEAVRWALDAGASPGLVGREREKFRDFWLGKTGQNATKADWPATWRNWIRRAIDDAKPGSGRGPPARGGVSGYGRIMADEAGLFDGQPGSDDDGTDGPASPAGAYGDRVAEEPHGMPERASPRRIGQGRD